MAPERLAPVIVDRLFRLYGWRVQADWLVWLPGLVPGLNVCCRAVGEQGDEVLSLTPVYPPFLSAPGNVGRKLVAVDLVDSDSGWQIDFDAMDAALSQKSRLFLFCHPHNPVGRIWSRGELAEIARICLQRDLVICSDEIHCELLLDQDRPHLPFAALDPEIGDRTITLMAPSKTFNIPGLGFSFAVISNRILRKKFRRAMTGLLPEVNPMGYAAALAAYEAGDAWLADLIAYLRGNRDLVEKKIAALPGMRMHHVEATYLAWIDVRQLGLLHGGRFFEEQAGVGLSDGADFGAPGFVRLNFGCRRSLLIQALERIEKAVRGR